MYPHDNIFNIYGNKNRSQKLKYGLCLREKQIPL